MLMQSVIFKFHYFLVWSVEAIKNNSKLIKVKMGTNKSVSTALSKLSSFLAPFLPLVNAHMVHFITGNIWGNLDVSLQCELLNLDKQHLANLPDDFLNIHSSESPHIGPSLRKLMEDVSSHTLASLNVLDDLQTLWNRLGIDPLTSMFNFDKFMKVKKTHEVGALCDVIASLAKKSQCELILDLGCGKGALGSLISLNHDVYVCGIDAAGFIAHVEEGRQAKLEKSFNADLKKSRSDEEPTDGLPQKKSLKFRRTTQFLSKDYNCNTVVNECRAHFQERFENRTGIVGLHTCGNLASTSVELFVNSPGTQFLCNVGCCYHLLDEAYENDDGHKEPGFPISSYLKSKRFVLGRNARMVAAQPLERYASQKKVTLKKKSCLTTCLTLDSQLQPDVLFYRALLQVILNEKLESCSASHYQVGRLRKTVDNFVQYARWAFGKLKLDLEVIFTGYYLDDQEFYKFLMFKLVFRLQTMNCRLILMPTKTRQSSCMHFFNFVCFSPL